MAKKIKNRKKILGMELILDLYDCNLKIITSKKKIQEFINRICRVIESKKYGPSLIKRFGSTRWGEGFSFLQFIEGSSITGHIVEPQRKCFVTIFSCKEFNPKQAANFTKKFFRAKKFKNRLVIH